MAVRYTYYSSVQEGKINIDDSYIDNLRFMKKLLLITTGGTIASAKGEEGLCLLYTSGYGGDVTVTLTIDENGKITDGKVNATTETDKIGQVAAPEVMQAIIDGNTVEVETVSGATMTSKAIIEASKDCLKQAGVGVEEKEVVKADDEEITVDVVCLLYTSRCV